jgi:glyoxylase-like metal-dependent hydrolase (beta-lactamase superfamily II)
MGPLIITIASTAAFSMRACASCSPACGTGRRVIRSGLRRTRRAGARRCRPYAIDDGEQLLLFDPVAIPSEVEGLAAGRETAIVLTNPWHERDTRSLVERLGAAVFVAPPDTEEDLVQMYGLSREQASGGSPDVAWLKAEDEFEGDWISAGDRLSVGVEVLPGMLWNDLLLWLESRGALVAGDTFVDRGQGLELPADWLRPGMTRERVLEALRPVLELPVELVLPAHGAPTDRAALERALS